MTVVMPQPGSATRHREFDESLGLIASTTQMKLYPGFVEALPRPAVGGKIDDTSRTRSLGEVESFVVDADASTLASSQSRPPRWSPYVSRRLNEMLNRSLEATGPYPRTSDIRAAALLIEKILPHGTPTPSVHPGDEVGVQFVWHKAGWDVEIEISVGSSTIWARRNSTGQMWDGPLVENLGALSAFLHAVTGD